MVYEVLASRVSITGWNGAVMLGWAEARLRGGRVTNIWTDIERTQAAALAMEITDGRMVCSVPVIPTRAEIAGAVSVGPLTFRFYDGGDGGGHLGCLFKSETDEFLIGIHIDGDDLASRLFIAATAHGRGRRVR